MNNIPLHVKLLSLFGIVKIKIPEPKSKIPPVSSRPFNSSTSERKSETLKIKIKYIIPFVFIPIFIIAGLSVNPMIPQKTLQESLKDPLPQVTKLEIINSCNGKDLPHKKLSYVDLIRQFESNQEIQKAIDNCMIRYDDLPQGTQKQVHP